MADLRSVLDDATKAALISPETAERLLPFLLDRHVAVASDGAADTDFAAQALAEDRLNAEPERDRRRAPGVRERVDDRHDRIDVEVGPPVPVAQRVGVDVVRPRKPGGVEPGG